MSKDRKNPSMENVRFLAIGEIAILWAKEIDLPLSMIERELQLGVINLARIRRGEEWIKEVPQ